LHGQASSTIVALSANRLLWSDFSSGTPTPLVNIEPQD